MKDNLTTIGSYSQPYEAHLVQQRLKDEGIPAFIANEHTIGINWLYSNALGGVQVQVPTDRAEEARHLLQTDVEDPSPEVLEDPILCPACGSPDTEPTKVRKFPVWIPLVLTAGVTYLFGPAFIMLAFPFLLGGPGVKCFTCQKESYTGKWPLKKVGTFVGVGIAALGVLFFLQVGYMAWNQDFHIDERDWDQDGNTSVTEYMESAFVVKVPSNRRDCFDYYHQFTHEHLKTECTGLSRSGLR